MNHKLLLLLDHYSQQLNKGDQHKIITHNKSRIHFYGLEILMKIKN